MGNMGIDIEMGLKMFAGSWQFSVHIVFHVATPILIPFLPLLPIVQLNTALMITITFPIFITHNDKAKSNKNLQNQNPTTKICLFLVVVSFLVLLAGLHHWLAMILY